MSRFGDITDVELENIINNKDSYNTKKATKVSINVFRDYLKEKGLDEQFETLSHNELDTLLSKFYVEARNAKGNLYKKSTLQSIRHGINRHLNSVNSECYDIINGLEYTKSRNVFDAVKKELKRQGKAVTIHKDIISDGDLKTLYKYFEKLDNPSKVFFDIMLYFGRRGRENLHSIKRNDFAIETDSQGLKYVRKVTDESTKNHQDDDDSSGSGVMYEVQGTVLCPVESFTKYLITLNTKIDAFFQRPKRNGPFDVSVMPLFDACPLGRNTLGQMMANISKAAGLSKVFTNHCIRATVVHLLDAGNIPSRHIMSVTGHKSEQSLKTYNSYTDESMKKRMAQILSNKTCTVTQADQDENNLGISVSSTSYNCKSDVVFPESAIDLTVKSRDFMQPNVSIITENPKSESETPIIPDEIADFVLSGFPVFEEAFEEIMRDITSDNINIPTNNSQNQFTPFMKDCNVTINYNFNN